jgi:hypothetical protein
MKPESSANRWEMLQVRAHLPQVRAIIRGGISRGTIRVVPAPGGGIRIIPARGASLMDDSDLSSDGRREQDQTNGPVLRIERITH